MSRSAVLASGILFAVLNVFAYHLFGWRNDGWILILASVVHLAILLRFHARLDAFIVGFHYIILLVAVGHIFWVTVDAVGTIPGAVGGVLLALLRDHWSNPVSCAFNGAYVVLMATLFLFVVVILSWLVRHRKPHRQELLVGLFVSSILNVPCDFARVDVLYHIVVLDPEKSKHIIFAVAFQSLDLPLLLHGLVVLFVVAYCWRDRKTIWTGCAT